MPPPSQGPHFHQGPPFPHGGIGNPWLGPHSAYYVDIQDPKQRRIAFDNVQKHVKEALGSTEYEGPPAQAPSSGSLTLRNGPVCFSDIITETFRQQARGGSYWSTNRQHHLPPTDGRGDRPPTGRLAHAHEGRDAPQLPTHRPGDNQHLPLFPGAGHVRPRPSEEKNPRYVPHHMVTITDLLRLLEEEEWRKHSTKVAATLASNNI